MYVWGGDVIMDKTENTTLIYRIHFSSLPPPSTVLAVSLQLRRACESHGACVAPPRRTWRATLVWPAAYEGTLSPIQVNKAVEKNE